MFSYLARPEPCPARGGMGGGVGGPVSGGRQGAIPGVHGELLLFVEELIILLLLEYFFCYMLNYI